MRENSYPVAHNIDLTVADPISVPPDPISVPGNTKWVVSHDFGFGQTATLVEKIFTILWSTFFVSNQICVKEF